MAEGKRLLERSPQALCVHGLGCREQRETGRSTNSRETLSTLAACWTVSSSGAATTSIAAPVMSRLAACSSTTSTDAGIGAPLPCDSRMRKRRLLVDECFARSSTMPASSRRSASLEYTGLGLGGLRLPGLRGEEPIVTVLSPRRQATKVLRIRSRGPSVAQRGACVPSQTPARPGRVGTRSRPHVPRCRGDGARRRGRGRGRRVQSRACRETRVGAAPPCKR